MIDPLVSVFHDNMRHDFSIATRQTPSFFGGPIDYTIVPKKKKRHLHQIAYLDSIDLPGLKRNLPLLFGMQYDACSLRYNYDFHGAIAIEDLDPAKPSYDWPYENFPTLIPYWPLYKNEPYPCSWDEFNDYLMNQVEESSYDYVVAIRPPVNIGLSLWGRHGDAEGVTIVWKVNASESIIDAFTCCS